MTFWPYEVRNCRPPQQLDHLGMDVGDATSATASLRSVDVLVQLPLGSFVHLFDAGRVIRPSSTSFVSVSRAASRRTGSKHEGRPLRACRR